jgi:uncharacterized protein
MMTDWYTRLYLWMMARRRGVLVVVAAVFVICTAISSRIDLEEDILDTLPQGDARVDEYRYAVRKFRQIDRVYIDVGVTNDDPDTLSAAADAVFAQLTTNNAYDRIVYRVELSGQGRIVDFFTGALPNLFTDADAEALAAKLQPQSIRDYLTTMRRKLAGPEGMVLKDIVAADPVGMSGIVANKVLPLQTGFSDTQIIDGRITSSDGRHVLILAEPKFASANTGESTALVQELLRTKREVQQRFPGVHVAITGGHRMTVDNATMIKSDATRCILLGTTAMVLLCLSAFRRRWLSLMTLLPSLFGTAIAGVVLAFTQEHLSAIATGFAAIAIGITVDYAIYVIYHLDNAAGLDQRAVGRHVGKLVHPITVGALTTVAAFVVMAGSPMHGYQQLGVFGAIGVLFSALFAIFILPLLVPIPKQSGQPPLWLTRAMSSFHETQRRWRPWLLVGVLALTIFTAFGLKKVRFDGDMARLNGITDSTREDELVIRNTWGDALGFTLVVARGTNVQDTLAANDRAAQTLLSNTNVATAYSLASVCPSLATQQTNVQRWNAFWTAERRAQLQTTLDQLARELGFRTDAFATFWRRLNEAPQPITLDSFRGTPLEQAVNERVALGTNDHAVSTLVKLNDRAHVEELREALPGAIVLDHKDFLGTIQGIARNSMWQFVIWTSLIVTALVYLSMASIELVAVTLVPIGIGLAWTFGLMGWLGLPIDLMNSVFVVFIVGMAEDYSIFLVEAKRDVWRGEATRLGATSASVLISALTTIFGFAVLVFAQHPVLFSMGTTVLLGMACAISSTLVLTPVCADLLMFKPQPQGAPRWWHVLGTVWVAVHLGLSQLFLYYVLRPLLKVFSPRDADAKLRRATSWMARGVVKGLPFGKLEFQNITPETFQPPAIVISNHQSAVDVMLVVSLPGDVRQVAKKRVFDNPALGIGCKLLGHVMVEPNEPEKTLQRCRERLSEGACVHFYPEGTRSKNGFVQRFHRGAFELAIELKRDVLPIVLCDTWTAMPRDAYWFEPYHVTVRALPRVTPQNFDYSQGAVALMRHCEALVRDGLQKQLDEVNTPRVVRRKVNRLYRYQGKFVEQFVFWKMRGDPLFNVIDSVVPRRASILDLGCGYGVVTQWLAQFTDTRRLLGVDYDEEKIRVAQRTAPDDDRIRFEVQNLLELELPTCDTALLLDVLHYWEPARQELILRKIRGALRQGGRLVLREADGSAAAGHQNVRFWERIATRLGHNRTQEGLHFVSRSDMESMLQRAGFSTWELVPAGGKDSNYMLVVKAA